MTLLELLIAISISAIVIGTLGAVAKAVQLNFEYGEGYGTVTQHARVVLDRITRTACGATASNSFPGFIVVAEKEGTWRFPDTLVVWRPSGPAANPEGLPQYNELILYCPDPQAPGQLLEITVPTNTSTVPPVSDEATWLSSVQAIKQSAASQKVKLTDRLRVCAVPGSTTAPLRGAVRFESRLRPSQSQWDQFTGGSLSWDRLSWAQGIYGSRTALRQAWLRTELQLVPGLESAASDAAARPAIPFFGSAALYYEMHKP